MINSVLAALSKINQVAGAGMLDFVNCFSLEKLVFDDEICGHVNHFIRDIEINEDLVSSFTSLGPFSDPDLCIRTGGEFRVSNFLLWHLAYSELYFTDIFWPDFDSIQFQKALDEYSNRQRRFGDKSNFNNK